MSGRLKVKAHSFFFKFNQDDKTTFFNVSEIEFKDTLKKFEEYYISIFRYASDITKRKALSKEINYFVPHEQFKS
jgi:hypothetical protein